MRAGVETKLVGASGVVEGIYLVESLGRLGPSEFSAWHVTEYSDPSDKPVNSIGSAIVGLMVLVSVPTDESPSIAVQRYPMILDFPVSTGSPIDVIEIFDGAATPAMEVGFVGTGGSVGITDTTELSGPKLLVS